MVMRKEAELWLSQASMDLKAAAKNLEDGYYYVAAHLSHQAAENALSAYCLEQKREEPSHGNQIDALAKKLGLPGDLVSRIKRLSPAYVLARYSTAATGTPSIYYDRKTAEDLISIAQEVVKWIKNELKK
jgi:HEPN domain-containing protein